MANPEHLAKLMEGREAWNRWRKRESGVEPDLSNASLRNIDLSGFELSSVNLNESDLTGALVTDTIFRVSAREAIWTYAQFVGTTWWETSASGSDFTGVSMQGTTFLNCSLQGSSFRDSELLAGSFIGSELQRADFSDAYLYRISFADSDLRDVAGLADVNYCSVGIDTFFRSGGLSPELLRIFRAPDEFITYAAALTGKAIEYYSCFISYSSKDNEFTSRLHADLQARQIRTWFAPENLKIGDRFHSRIDESIRIHDKLVLILSEYSINSAWVRREVESAREREDREKKDILFPIRLDDTVFESTEPWAAEIRRSKHIGDFRNWKSHDDYTVALDRLVLNLKKEGPIVMR